VASPIFLSQVIKNHEVEVQFFCQVEYSQISHDLACVSHPAAIPNRDFSGTHFFQFEHQAVNTSGCVDPGVGSALLKLGLIKTFYQAWIDFNKSIAMHSFRRVSVHESHPCNWSY
jgi:hypothetical protein